MDRTERVGRAADREAARIGAAKVAFGPLIRDQGHEKLPTGDGARAVVRGLLLARDTDLRLQREGLSKKYVLEKWVEETGPDFYRETIAGVKTGIDEARGEVGKRKTTSFGNAGR